MAEESKGMKRAETALDLAQWFVGLSGDDWMDIVHNRQITCARELLKRYTVDQVKAAVFAVREGLLRAQEWKPMGVQSLAILLYKNESNRTLVDENIARLAQLIDQARPAIAEFRSRRDAMAFMLELV